MCMSVDLPEPDGPMTAVSLPASMSSVTPLSASTAVSPSPYRREISCAVTTGPAPFPPGCVFTTAPSFPASVAPAYMTADSSAAKLVEASTARRPLQPELRGEREPVADREPSARALSGRELENRLCTPSGRGTPGLHAVFDSKHDEGPVEEDDVDREAHEKGVNGRGGLEQEALPLLQPCPSEQAPQAGHWGVGERASLADDCPVFPPEDQLFR